MLENGKVLTLRLASYTVAHGSITYEDILLGQYTVTAHCLVPIGSARSSTLLKRTLHEPQSNSVMTKEGYLTYSDVAFEPQEAREKLVDTLRDALELSRMALNQQVKDINRVLEGI